MKRKTKILLISYASAAVVALAVALVACRAGAASYETRLDANYRHAFSEVLTAVQELDTSLKKSVYAATPAMECAVCTEIYSDAQTAEMASAVSWKTGTSATEPRRFSSSRVFSCVSSGERVTLWMPRSARKCAAAALVT